MRTRNDSPSPGRRRHSIDRSRQVAGCDRDLPFLTRGVALRGSARPGYGVGWVVRHLIAHVEAHGFDAEPIRSLPGLRGHTLEDPDALFPERALHEAWRIASALTGDEALGLHLAEQLPRGTLDLVEYSFRASNTLGGALERLARYGRLLNDRLAARVLAGGRDLRFLACEADGRPLDRGRADLTLALVLRLARETTTRELAPLRVCFGHEAPASTAEHRRFFRAPLHFSAGVSEIAFSGQDAGRPLLSADAALSGVVKRRLEKLLAHRERPDAGATAARVRQLLIDGEGQAEASVTRVARELGLSERTLGRRLAREETSFRAILEGVRAETATALLHDSALGIAEIAFFLGYSEPAAFHRSFKRWTGKTPLTYRREVCSP
jgi:AraC-like DNA-binding protein